MDFWRTASAVWANHPVLGAGLGTFPTAYAEVRVPAKQFLADTVFKPPPHAHNLTLQLLAEQGLVGLVAFGAVFAAALHHGLALRRSSERWLEVLGTAMVAALAAFFVHNLFDVTLLERTGSYFWGVLGLLGALSAIDSRAAVGVPAPTVCSGDARAALATA